MPKLRAQNGAYSHVTCRVEACLVRGHLQLVLHVDLRCGKEGVHPGPLCQAYRLPCCFQIPEIAAPLQTARLAIKCTWLDLCLHAIA